MEKLKKLYDKVDTMGFSEVRPAVKQAIQCMFYLAKLHLPPEAKSLKAIRLAPPSKKRTAKKRKAR
jgi:hypothetical protein